MKTIVRTLVLSLLVAAMTLSILVGMAPYIIIATMLAKALLHV